MKRGLFSSILLFLFFSVSAQNVNLDYYLPDDVTYDKEITKPSSILGFEVGEWHVNHTQVVQYYKAIAAQSPKATLITYGQTYEKRPLIMLAVSSPKNIKQLDKLKEQRGGLRYPDFKSDLAGMPVVMYMGHSVHGNEASGVNASLLSAYHFTAAKEIEEDLENIILLIDPAINPDGINRFASWVNSHKSYYPNGDRNNRELNEAWPRGRTNHYWFDLNRDWLPVQHPESKGRIAQLQEWLPNIVLDFHEMGTDNTYFFQPGIPSRNNPLTPAKNFELTEKIATYHAKYLDKIGSLYYSKESFDDYYFGKGSTYPDIQGAVGILFEQASSRGNLHESDYGKISFPFTIRNQFTTALSSFDAATDMRVELNTYMSDFYKDAKTEYTEDDDKAIIFGAMEDYGRTFHFADILLQHNIQLYSLEEDVTLNGVPFKSGKSFIVPLDQPQYRLVKSLFESRTTFQDSLFYDVSTWNMPMAFNLNSLSLSSKILNLAKVVNVSNGLSFKEGKVIGEAGAYSYAFEWDEYYTPKALYKLMDLGYQLRVSHKEFQTKDKKNYGRGTILVEKGNSEKTDKAFYEDLKTIAAKTGVNIYALSTGLTGGVNLGSPSISVLKKPSIALLVDDGVGSADAGEIWHLFDQRMEIPITLMATHRMSVADLDRYNVIILPTGDYSILGEKEAEKLKSWVQKGGTLISRGSAMNWLADNDIAVFNFQNPDYSDTTSQKQYADLENARGAKVTGGAIFKAKLDITHPIGYGYKNAEIHVFKQGNQFLEPSGNPYANPLVYAESPLASGYVHPTNLAMMKNKGVIQISGKGKGKTIGFVDNPNFRAYWFGTNKMFLNAVFFGQTINNASTR
ncbi:M14 family metallopeptidase [Cyclobacterium qasimii]|uniref:Secreted protein containing N-terminal Zinc-dependent carboxypeptidase related domain protein n=2 Tax=Cyclobacterium qasimii TaxID=1350429 RepID=S7WNK4_9BACT|nr:M14 family metallopeptidase [Cyclobacterium qasimii]EPR65733.1 Secreted protein containing N-terminal Zinc-dependent carboxypeptidase related domain protein [Cyclobacterium qasimii M12-11B]GEO23227.1 peptidase M14 [Cyclobacterium qasimii]